MWTFKPILKPTLWGGTRIASYKKQSPAAEAGSGTHIGESLELSALPGFMSVVADGSDAGHTLHQLVARYGATLMGRAPYSRFGSDFPLLIKFLDAQDDLSVQVHPDDAMARKLGMPYGKNELWYILESRPDARLYIGMTRPVTESEYHELVANGKFGDLLKCASVSPGEVYNIPAGTPHSLGKGCMVVEIQQTSDTTYRIYDYNRRDSHGILRELHTELALQAMRHDSPRQGRIRYTDIPDTEVALMKSPEFCVNRLRLTRSMSRDYTQTDSFKIIILVSGFATLDDGATALHAVPGTVVLVAADRKRLDIAPAGGECVILETYLEAEQLSAPNI